MLIPGTISMIVVTLLLLSDSVIAGLILGQDAVAAISLVTPAYSLAAFFGGIISIGVPILYSKAMGEFNKKAADRYFALGFTSAIAIGIFLTSTFFVFGDYYLRSYKASEAVFNQAHAYFFWYKLTILLTTLNMLISEMILADGDETLSLVSSLVQVVGNIVLSVILSRFYGMSGIAFASFAGTAAALIIAFIHFFKKSNSLKIGFFFSFRELLSVVKYSAIDAGSYLFLACFTVGIEHFIIITFGPEMLILASVFLLVKEFQLVFDGIGEAITPIMNIYLGEESCPAIRKCYRLAKKTAIIEGLIITLIMIAFSPLIVKIYGITAPHIVGFADNGAKIIALGLIHVSLLYLLTSYYLIIDRILLGFVISGLRDVVASLPLCILFGKLFGVYGMFAGGALAPIAAYYLSLLFVRLRYGKANTPLLLSDREKSLKAAFYEFTITPEAVIAVQKNVGDFLRANNVDRKLVSKTELLIEELYMLVYERNDKKPTVCAECTALIRDDGIQIIEKDDGLLFDLTDEDSLPSSLGAFVVASYMEKMKGNKMYLTTMSYNRNTFRVR